MISRIPEIKREVAKAERGVLPDRHCWLPHRWSAWVRERSGDLADTRYEVRRCERCGARQSRCVE